MTDWAAALTYYGLLSLFPAMLALVSVLGLFGDPEATTREISEVVTRLGPDTAADTSLGARPLDHPEPCDLRGAV